MAVKPIIQQASAMFSKAFKYSVKFKKYPTTCLKLLIVFSVTYAGYIFLNNPDTTFVPLTACAIFTLYLLFILVKPVIQQAPAMCFKAFKHFVKFAKYAVICCVLLIVFSLIHLAGIFLKNAMKRFTPTITHAVVKSNNVDAKFVVIIAKFVVIIAHAIIALFLLFMPFYVYWSRSYSHHAKAKRSKNKKKRLRIK